MPRRKSITDSETDNPSFEEALAGLESIVEAMENEQLPLEELVAHYEKGSILLGRCEAMLQGARERIELITLRNQEDPAPTPISPAEADDSDNHDDIRLF